MKTTAPVVCVSLAIAIGLQGCSQWQAADDVGAVLDKDAIAKCKDGKFSCDGVKEWCAEQMKKCKGSVEPTGSCQPTCTWKCQTSTCDQTCAPQCNQPVCSTRCNGFNTESCRMECGKPKCVVVCPKFLNCPNQNCAKCKTKCSGEPVCNMVCGKDEQPCRHVCAEPQCKWKCSKPTDCPKPKCKMQCEQPHQCMDNTHMVKQLPPLEPGETEVTIAQASPQAGAAPAAATLSLPAPAPAAAATLVGVASTVYGKRATLHVNFTTMERDHSVQERQVELPLALEASQVGHAWTTKVRTHTRKDGQVIHLEASCKDGDFQCEGDGVWCEEQKRNICETGHHVFLQHRHLNQGHLLA